MTRFTEYGEVAAEHTSVKMYCPDYQVRAEVMRDERGRFCSKCARSTTAQGEHGRTA